MIEMDGTRCPQKLQIIVSPDWGNGALPGPIIRKKSRANSRKKGSRHPKDRLYSAYVSQATTSVHISSF